MDTPPRRALILAGGGLKVAFQAGALQVWLDEAGLDFDLADGCSGGCLNLAMYCQGHSGTAMADAWRRYRPLSALDLNARELLKLGVAESLFELDKMRETVFPDWSLDWDAIRASNREATFNAYNFSRHALAVWTPAQMDEDRLISCISLPMWFPPVVIDGETHIDSVFITDANLEEAIRRGADELWVIWTVSQLAEWRNGFVPQYFQIIETSANGHFRRMLARIEKNNAALAAGESSEFGRAITVRLLEAEVDMHYLINLTRDRVAEAVNAGVMAARAWCRKEGIPLNDEAAVPPSTDIHDAHTELRFTEEMKGFVAFGETAPEVGFRRGQEQGTDLMFHLTIDVQGVNRFVTRPDHQATARGWVQGAAVDGRQPVRDGVFNLFVDEGDPRVRYMRYRLHLGGERPLTLFGEKTIRDDPGWDVWADTTTLVTRLVPGHLDWGDEAETIASGLLRIPVTSFLRQLTTFRTEGPTAADRAAALARFGRLFLGNLWDVYHAQPAPDLADPLAASLQPIASRNGVTLRTRGEGKPVFVIPGMEGSGESCLHLAVPVLDAAPDHRLVLVDYGNEKHPTLEALAETVSALVAEVAGAAPCRVWAQSFGNLLAVALAGQVAVERWAFVSPFTELPAWKAHGGTLSLAVTPSFLYRATIRPMGKYLFGPPGDADDHPFFDALYRAPVPTVRRRTSWLRGRDAQAAFEAVPGEVHVWLGALDRLVDLDDQRRRFAALAASRPHWHLSMIEGSGHVVLPTSAVETARREVASWILT